MLVAQPPSRCCNHGQTASLKRGCEHSCRTSSIYKIVIERGAKFWQSKVMTQPADLQNLSPDQLRKLVMQLQAVVVGLPWRQAGSAATISVL